PSSGRVAWMDRPAGDRTSAAYPAGTRRCRRSAMAWVVLLLSGVLEAVWATALGKSDGFTRLVPSLVFVVALVLSMAGLSWAMRSIPVGTAYAVWVGIRAGRTGGIAMLAG